MKESQTLINALKAVRRSIKPWYSCAYMWINDPDSIKFVISIYSDTEFVFDSIESMQEWLDKFKPNGDREIIHRKFKL